MRVIAGKARGHPLKSLATKEVRPTGDRVKEALFNMIRPRLSGADFLDLFAGFGGVGIEALSQGAGKVFFMEQNLRVVKVLKENLKKTSLEEGARVFQTTLPAGLKVLAGRSFPLIFLDPPYQSKLILPVLQTISSLQLLSPGGLIVVEHASSTPLSQPEIPFLIYQQRRYGQEHLSFLTRDGNGSSV